MTAKHLLALLGFAFVAAWIAFDDFGSASSIPFVKMRSERL